jgi:hypothetical protein
VESKPTPASHFATLYYFLAIVALAAAAVAWLLLHLGAKEHHGTLVYTWLVGSIGVLCPSVGMLVWWLLQTSRGKERAEEACAKLSREKELAEEACAKLSREKELAEEACAKLRRELDETVPIRYAGIEYRDLAVHLLDECYQNVKLLTVELKKESGPHYSKAKDRHLATLRVLARVCKDRFEKDKRLLQRGLTGDHDEVMRKFVTLKEALFELFDHLEQSLGAKSNGPNQARVSIEFAGRRLGEFVQFLDHEISLLASDSSRPRA